jgi:hypothetical protein
MDVAQFQDRQYRRQAFGDAGALHGYLDRFLEVNSLDSAGSSLVLYVQMYWGRAVQAYLKKNYTQAVIEARRAAAFFAWESASRVWDRRYTISHRYTELTYGIKDQVQHHFDKYGAQRVSVLDWVAIITEEMGETAEEIIVGSVPDTVTEAQQTLACISRFITEVKRVASGAADRESERYTAAV